MARGGGSTRSTNRRARSGFTPCWARRIAPRNPRRSQAKLKRRVESSKATENSPRQPDSSSANSSEDQEHDDGNWSAEGDGLHQGDNPRRSSSAGSTATSPSPLLDALAKRIAARRNSLSLEAETGDVEDGDGKK